VTRSWSAPDGLATRGTLLVLPGRGEHSGVYERFSRRLAADAYAVHAVDVRPDDESDLVHEKISTLIHGAAAPVVLVGSDTGALHALAAATDSRLRIDGLVIAALPAPDTAVDAAIDAAPEADWGRELAARTTCPAHRARLTADESFIRGSLADPIPPHLAKILSEPLEDLAVPALVLHGGSDPIAPVDHARELAARLPRAELAVVDRAPHDVLNDSTHRTVAAQVVQWLERLRGSADLTPLITVTVTSLAPVPAGS